MRRRLASRDRLEALQHQRVADAVDGDRDGALVLEELEELLHVLRGRDEVDVVATLGEAAGAQLARQRCCCR